jgi:hypothetical protein
MPAGKHASVQTAGPSKEKPQLGARASQATAKPSRISQGRTSQLNAPGYSVFRQHEKPQRMQAPGNGPSGGDGAGGITRVRTH